jgi:hypothetical protein
MKQATKVSIAIVSSLPELPVNWKSDPALPARSTANVPVWMASPVNGVWKKLPGVPAPAPSRVRLTVSSGAPVPETTIVAIERARNHDQPAATCNHGAGIQEAPAAADAS